MTLLNNQPQTNAREVRGYFNAIAGRYDLMNSLLSFGLHHLWKRRAVRMACVRPGWRVLDACGGTADLALGAAGFAGPAGRIVIADFSMDMLRAGRKKIALQKQSGRIACVCGDALELFLKDNSFDAAFIGFGLRNLTDTGGGLRELRRILKPGGRLVCLEFSHPPKPFFRRLYDLYSFYGIPFLGKLIAGSREAYTYLPESIRRFPGPQRLAVMLEDAGFSEVAFHLLCLGVAAIHTGKKRDE